MAYKPALDLDQAMLFSTDNVGETWDLNILLTKATEFQQVWFALLDPRDPKQEPLYRWIIPLTADILSIAPASPTLEDLWRLVFDVSSSCGAAVNGGIPAALDAALLAAYNDVYS